MDLEKYRRLFVEEANDHLVEMSGALTALEGGPSRQEADEAIDTLFRMAHSIKGMAASLDYASVSSLSHSFEDWMELDLQYVDQWSLRLDLTLLIKTIPAVLTCRGAY